MFLINFATVGEKKLNYPYKCQKHQNNILKLHLVVRN